MLWAKIYLGLPAVTGVLFALVAVYTFFGMTRPNSKGPITAAEWALAIAFGLVVLLLHAGYIMAPFAIGKSWHRTALWWMMPLGAIVATMLLFNLRWYLSGLWGDRPHAEPMFRGALGLSFGVVWYILPVVLMWVTRPPLPTPAPKPVTQTSPAKSGIVTKCTESEVARAAAKPWAHFIS